MKVVTDLFPGPLAAVENNVVDNERKVARGDLDGPPVLISPTEFFPEYLTGLYTLAPDLCGSRDL